MLERVRWFSAGALAVLAITALWAGLAGAVCVLPVDGHCFAGVWVYFGGR